MKKEIFVQSNQVIIKLYDEFYVEDASSLRESMLPYFEKNYTDYVVDLTNLKYIDSSGLGVLIAIHKKAKANNGNVIIKGMNGAVKELFELTRLTKVFDTQ
ncbi:anti-sigma B factor antagonist [Bacillus ectoiniformans]|uniref:STAS domain-containing protein n=1 Tax=Bacillus ectoiniformans TaxID=1494429 RepID=UPI00195757C7|nr:STAS domain-containing protein [Bacillus ectoiniformans]MBM7648217.1 anti-sigma B factor antagonist [Bacillus ectoiniformans]